MRGNVAAGMPSFADLAAGDRAALVNYLLRLNVETITKPAPIAPPTRPTTWAAPQPGDTAGGLIFYGRPNGGFAAVDQRDGKTRWKFPTNVRMKASAMTFAVAAGPNILCFGL